MITITTKATVICWASFRPFMVSLMKFAADILSDSVLLDGECQGKKRGWTRLSFGDYHNFRLLEAQSSSEP